MLTVLTTGTFDLLHNGHVALFAEIKERYPESHIIVGINGDRRVSEIKDVVLFSAEERAAILSALRNVDQVIVFEEDTPLELIGRVRPDVFAKGPDWAGKDLPEADVCKEVGAAIVFIGEKTNWSSRLKGKLGC